MSGSCSPGIMYYTLYVRIHSIASYGIPEPVEWVIGLWRHEQATDTAEDLSHGDTRSVAWAKHPVANPATAVDVAVVNLTMYVLVKSGKPD